MRKWSRVVPFEFQKSQHEVWTYRNLETEKHYSVDVIYGKPIDILSLKTNMIEGFSSNVAKARNSRTALFIKDDLERVNSCPICQYETRNMPEVLVIYGAKYCRCNNCDHYFVIERPSRKSLEDFYCKDDDYQNTYANKRTSQVRIENVALPKAKWMIRQFERVYGRRPQSILDVGAGSGHFVWACKKLGLKAVGVEPSETGRRFCKETFGFELMNMDFTKEFQAVDDEYEIVTLWGVIEHVPYPLEMLSVASMIVSGKEGLVIAEVPRWDCLSTAIQSIFPDSVVRHLDPLGHIHCFTDSSLATAFQLSNLDLVAAWYFGMDAYELLTQISYLLKDDMIIKKIGEYIPAFQKRIDLARLSDEMAFAAKPRS